MYEIILGPHARRFLRKADKKLYERITSKIKDLSIEPFPSDAKRVVSKKEKVFRIRIGKYRVQYVVFHKEKEIFITDIDKRPKAY